MLDTLKTIIEVVQGALTSIGIVVGAVWAYFRFFKDRIYRPRLDVTLSGRWTTIGDTTVLAARLELKNIGAGRVTLIEEGAGLLIEAPVNYTEPTQSVGYERIAGPFTILADHEWIESGETVAEEIYLNIGPAPITGVRLTNRLTPTFRFTRRRITITTRQLVPPPTPEPTRPSWIGKSLAVLIGKTASEEKGARA